MIPPWTTRVTFAGSAKAAGSASGSTPTAIRSAALSRFHRPGLIGDARDPSVVPGGGDDGLPGSCLLGDQAEFHAVLGLVGADEIDAGADEDPVLHRTYPADVG
jgi:hypothetical protein